ncbi:hypothetical protein PRVXH_000512 [Proteinivorax hydrogeniformans]|uniref:Flagellar operon protein (TIGR03826 family) n=1 Tax=Proteinivorax hydrogeniformans TaxID=1826727 RepID=A0AAU8HV09_9FIRM
MKLGNCRKCGKIMYSNGYFMCSECKAEEYSSYKLVRDYVYDNKGATVLEVAEATGVDKSVILRYVKEERLSLLDDRSILPRCRVCGAFVDNGEVCDSCK